MFKFLLIFIATIYLFGYLGRFLFARWIKKVQNNNPYNQQQQQESKKEGSVSVDNDVKTKKAFNANDGDYVDYEEVE